MMRCYGVGVGVDVEARRVRAIKNEPMDLMKLTQRRTPIMYS